MQHPQQYEFVYKACVEYGVLEILKDPFHAHCVLIMNPLFMLPPKHDPFVKPSRWRGRARKPWHCRHQARSAAASRANGSKASKAKSRRCWHHSSRKADPKTCRCAFHILWGAGQRIMAFEDSFLCFLPACSLHYRRKNGSAPTASLSNSKQVCVCPTLFGESRCCFTYSVVFPCKFCT